MVKIFFFKTDNMWLNVLSPNPTMKTEGALLLMYSQFYKVCLTFHPAPAEKMLRNFWKVKATLRGEERRGWSNSGGLLHVSSACLCCPIPAGPGTESPG